MIHIECGEGAMWLFSPKEPVCFNTCQMVTFSISNCICCVLTCCEFIQMHPWPGLSCKSEFGCWNEAQCPLEGNRISLRKITGQKSYTNTTFKVYLRHIK